MFERLKKLIFDESGELEPQEDVIEIESDSLEHNKNLIKTQPIPKPVASNQEETAVLVEPSSNVFKRIDIEEVSVNQPEIIKEEVIKAEPIQPKPKKPVRSTKPYKPRPVISPMFGISQAEDERTKQIKVLTKPEAPTSNENIISPMYGKVTSEQEIETKHSKPSVRRRRTQAVNISLEEMLNMPAQEDLEFTLFDVKVDRDEFKSRENMIIKDDNE